MMRNSLATVLTASRATTIAATCCMGIIIGLFTVDFFRILSSISVIVLVVTAISYGIIHRTTEQIIQWKVYAAYGCVFIINLASGFYTQHNNLRIFWQDLILQSPFILLPSSFLILPSFSSRALRKIYFLFYFLVLVSAIGSIANYLFNIEAINESYLRSKVMPTVPDHIRFSLMVALAIAIGVTTLENHKISIVKKLILRLTISFLIAYLLILAVRSGLIAFYSIGIIYIMWLLFEKKKYFVFTALTVTLLILPIISFKIFPTFRNKFHNTRADVEKFDETISANNYSLVGRVYSYKVAVLLIRQHPWIGVSKADMREKMEQQYRVSFPSIKPIAYLPPHNQFLYYLVAFGIIGLSLFTVAFYYPVINIFLHRSPLLLSQYVIVSLSFLVEYTLETQVGITFTLLFLILPTAGLAPSPDEDLSWRPT